jgi:imidazolonepropionase-like amidohydrolase
MPIDISHHEKIAFVHANVLAMTDAEVAPNQTVCIADGKITSIGETPPHSLEDYALIDADGRYLLPALTDMHTHLGDNEDDLLLYLVNGVTTIRSMWGYEGFGLRRWLFGTRVFRHLHLRDEVNAGRILGPSIYTAGPLLEGTPSFFPRFMVEVVTSRQQAEDTVTRQANQGYDCIKFYSTVSAEVFDALVHAARRHGIAIAGHVPDAVGLENVIAARVTSVEHLLGFFHPYQPNLAVPARDIPRLAELSAVNDVSHCPTLIASERISHLACQSRYESEPEMAYLPKRIKGGMRFLQKASHDLLQKRGLKPNHEYLPTLFQVIRELQRQGARILVGTDKATPYVVAGFAVHRELQLLHDAGLTPFEVLKAATVNAAECLRATDTSGTIEPGKRADLLLTPKNPLQDLSTLANHCGVMTHGRWISRQQCDQILESIRQKHRSAVRPASEGVLR